MFPPGDQLPQETPASAPPSPATRFPLACGAILTGGWPASPPEFLAWLELHGEEIVGEWVERLGVLSPNYRQRPQEELFSTVSKAYAANLAALARGDLAPIDGFIEYITAKRLRAGFPLSDVQKAFELFRLIVTRRLGEQGRSALLGQAQEALGACLSHTIHRFSDHFQGMHEQVIRRHAQQLEDQVDKRTAELAESERRYKTLVNEINDGYFMIQDGFIIFANQAFCRMHSAELAQVLGQPFLGFVDEADREMMGEAYQEVVAGRPSPTQVEYRRRGCPPERAATEIKSRVVDLGQGPVVIGICRDISARVAMENTLREHERLAYVGHLTASLSHEIRNPLSAIKMNMQILARRLSLDGYDLRRLQITVREITRLEDILCQLLDTARPLQLRTGPVDLAALARGCLEVLEPKTQEKRLRVTQRHPAKPPLAQADASRLEQALMNLMLNAIEASPAEGEVLVWTEAGQEEGRAYVELGVQDSGAGVDPRHLPHVFTPFFTSKAKGTGLGLSNVKRVVEAHGGRVLVGGRAGGGAVFSMRLPCPP